MFNHRKVHLTIISGGTSAILVPALASILINLTACGTEKHHARTALDSQTQSDELNAAADLTGAAAKDKEHPADSKHCALSLTDDDDGDQGDDLDGDDDGGVPAAGKGLAKKSTAPKPKSSPKAPNSKSQCSKPTPSPTPTASPTTSPSPVPTTSPTPSPTPTPVALDGSLLYAQKCQNCHGAKAQTNINDKTAAGIQSAIASIGAMKSIQMSSAEITAVSNYLMAP